jgi:WD40 repeat protein/serine/threonine protein kinase
MRCLVREGAALRRTPAPAAPLPKRFGDYEILREIGRGGMGRVYSARQISLGRIVALKVIAGSEIGSAHLADRLRNEAEAAASLEHPNIVSIYEVGAQDGWNYLSMRLVEGRTLGQEMGNKPLPFQRAAQVLATLARAIQHAHERGVLHRDIKPGNVLLDVAGVPHLTDFGLAKFTERQSDLTITCTVMGTPAYMSPEQAAGRSKEITTATDIYGLGAVLFEMLTGQAPFAGETPMAIARQVIDRDPPRPNALNPTVPLDLAVICLKCLEKEPRRRYESGAALAEDLERWLRHEPIKARPSTPVERLGKLMHRYPARTALVLTVLLALVVVAVVSSAMTVRLKAAKSQTETANLQLSKNLRELESQKAEELAEDGQPADALAMFARFLRQNPDDALVASRIISMLSSHSYAFPIGQPLPHQASVLSVRFSPKGDRVVTASDDGYVKIWDAHTAQLQLALNNGSQVASAYFTTDGECIIAICVDAKTRVWDASTGKLVSVLPGGGSHVAGLPSPADKRVATIEGQKVRLWDRETGKLASPVIEPAAPISNMKISPDGRWLAIGCEDGSVSLWDSRTSLMTAPLMRSDGGIRPLIFTPDGKRLIAGTHAGVVAFWDPQSGGLVKQTRAAPNEPTEVYWVYCSPDSRYALTLSFQNRARLWNTQTGEPLSGPFGDASMIASADFSPDSRRVVMGTREGAARIWDVTTQEALCEPFEHEGPIEFVAFSPEGRTVATASQDATARLWDTGMLSPRPCVTHLPGRPFKMQFSPDGRRLAVTAGKLVHLLDSTSGADICPPMAHDDVAYWVTFSPDGSKLATTSEDNAVRVWDAHSGKLIRNFLHSSVTWTAAFSPNGHLIATGSRDRILRLFVTDTGENVANLQHPSEVIGVEFSGDGEKCLTACVDGGARVFSTSAHKLIAGPMMHKGIVWTATFSPDYRRIVTASADRTARLWDAMTGKPLGDPMLHTKDVWSAEFSPDGRYVVTASEDGTARVWDGLTGNPISPPLRHRQGAAVYQACFSPDGAIVASASGDGTARLWDALTGQPMSEPMRHSGVVDRVCFSPDGRRVVTGSRDQTVRFWEVVRAPQPVAPWLAELAEDLAGRGFNTQGKLETRPPGKLQELKDRLTTGAGTDYYSRWAKWFFVDRFQEPVKNFSP